jgi:DUF1680 family protein
LTDLYRYLDSGPGAVAFRVNGRKVETTLEKGFAVIRRTWTQSDTVQWTFPMPVRRVVASDRTVACAGRVALDRGPLVYCAEGMDNAGMLSYGS